MRAKKVSKSIKKKDHQKGVKYLKNSEYFDFFERNGRSVSIPTLKRWGKTRTHEMYLSIISELANQEHSKAKASAELVVWEKKEQVLDIELQIKDNALKSTNSKLALRDKALEKLMKDFEEKPEIAYNPFWLKAFEILTKN